MLKLQAKKESIKDYTTFFSSIPFFLTPKKKIATEFFIDRKAETTPYNKFSYTWFIKLYDS